MELEMLGHVADESSCRVPSLQLIQALMDCVFVGRVKGNIAVSLWVSSLILSR